MFESHTSKADQDESWLYDMYPQASDYEIDRFSERVAIRVVDGMLEDEARRLTLSEIKARHAKKLCSA